MFRPDGRLISTGRRMGSARTSATDIITPENGHKSCPVRQLGKSSAVYLLLQTAYSTRPGAKRFASRNRQYRKLLKLLL